MSSLPNSGNRSSKLAVFATNMESSSPLAATQIKKEEIAVASENLYFLNLSSFSGFSRHTKLMMMEENDDMLMDPTPTKLIK